MQGGGDAEQACRRVFQPREVRSQLLFERSPVPPEQGSSQSTKETHSARRMEGREGGREENIITKELTLAIFTKWLRISALIFKVCAVRISRTTQKLTCRVKYTHTHTPEKWLSPGPPSSPSPTAGGQEAGGAQPGVAGGGGVLYDTQPCRWGPPSAPLSNTHSDAERQVLSSSPGGITGPPQHMNLSEAVAGNFEMIRTDPCSEGCQLWGNHGQGVGWMDRQMARQTHMFTGCTTVRSISPARPQLSRIHQSLHNHNKFNFLGEVHPII